MDSFATQREKMVAQQLMTRGINDARVLNAMRTVPREAFIPAELRDRSYRDGPLPIGEGQTISQPYMVAYMAQLLDVQPTDRLLEVGAGSGYAAAVLSRLAAEVYAMDIHFSLVEAAGERLAELGYDNVHVVLGDGTRGLPAHAPFDGITVAAGGRAVPEPLKQQLNIGGKLVIPVSAGALGQRLLCITRTGHDTYTETSLGNVHFVPLISQGDANDE